MGKFLKYWLEIELLNLRLLKIAIDSFSTINPINSGLIDLVEALIYIFLVSFIICIVNIGALFWIKLMNLHFRVHFYIITCEYNLIHAKFLVLFPVT